MKQKACVVWCPCNGIFLLLLVLLLCGSLLSGVLAMIDSASASISLPEGAMLPLSAVAVGGTVWGLWLGFRHHGNAQPLALGLFGLLATGIGLTVLAPIALLGITAVLVAVVWSSMAATMQH